MLKFFAFLFGLLFIIAGILGFLPDYTPDGKLFGYFTTGMPYNIGRLAVGVIALLCGLSGSGASKTFLILFGLAFAVFAGLGFYYGEGLLFKTVAVNKADNWLHASLAVIFLYFGLFLHRK